MKSKIAQKHKVKWRKNEKLLGTFIFFAYLCTPKSC